MLVNLLGSLPNFIAKVATVYLKGLQTLLGRLPNFIGKVVKIYWEGCQILLGRLPTIIGKVVKMYWEGNVTKLYGQMDILIYNTFYQIPILFSVWSLILFILFAMYISIILARIHNAHCCHLILILLTTTFKENI